MKKLILAFISIIFSFSTLADVDKRFVKKSRHPEVLIFYQLSNLFPKIHFNYFIRKL